MPSTAWGYYPSTFAGRRRCLVQQLNGWYNNPVVGNYGWLTIIHETGHLLGLKHPQDVMGSFGAVPANVELAGILRDELSLLYRSLDHAGPHQRDLELSDRR